MNTFVKTPVLPFIVIFLGFLALRATATTYYVDINSANPTPPYTNWATAATDIQSAVNQTANGDLVMVNDGVYQTGGQVVDGSLTNRVVISDAITVESVNGPGTTVIQGYQDTNTINGDDAIRCVYLSNGAVLSGFTLTNGATQIDTDESEDYTLYSGGGVFCDTTNVVVTNCVITGCSASDVGGGAEGLNTFLEAGGAAFFNCTFTSNQCIAGAGADQCILVNCTFTGNTGGYGGGASSSTLINCTLANNSAFDSGSGNGGGADACTLIGCTLETNSSDIGGGAWGNQNNPCTLTNCTLIGNSSGSDGGGAIGCTLTNCTLMGNSAGGNGGGANSSTLINCVLTSNFGLSGGGAENCSLNNCTLGGNGAAFYGGGADSSTLNQCTLINNQAGVNGISASGILHIIIPSGGGAENSTLTNCILTGNQVEGYSYGGGVDSSTLVNCLLAANSAGILGGGANNSTLFSCTVADNSAGNTGGGVNSCSLTNSIVYFNSAPGGTNYSDDSTLSYSDADPLATSGAGNIDADPMFVNPSGGDFHLKAFSPCIDTGNNADVVGDIDLDGNPRIVNGTVDMGAYEYQGNVHYVDVNGSNPTPPYLTWATAATNIQDAVDVAADGDGILVTNGVYQTGGILVHGGVTNRLAVTKPVTVQSVNGAAATVIEGYQMPGVTNGPMAMRCVYLTNGAALTGFTLTEGATFTPANSSDWYNEQSGGAVWCESTNSVIANCVIVGNSAGDSGGGGINGTFVNCTFLNNFAYDVGGAVYNSTLSQCILNGNFGNWGGGGGFYPYWIPNGSVVNACLFTNNVSAYNGGGVWGGHVSNCMFTGNIVTDQYYNDGEAYGGGAEESTLVYCILAGNTANISGGADQCDLYNCLLTNNYAAFTGGGMSYCYAYDCTSVNNSAGQAGGGSDGGLLNNCIIYFNNAPTNANLDWDGGTFNYSCITPAAPGVNNITNDPAFVDLANGDLHLQSNSPCINAGDNYYPTNNYDGVDLTADLDGNPRVVGGTVDIGAYEYQTPTSVISYAYLQQYGLPTDGSVDFADLDGTGFNVYQDWIAGLNPTNSASVLAVLPPTATNNAAGITVTWLSVTNVLYDLQRSSDLTGSFTTIQSDIVGQAGTTSYQDTSATNNLPYFYRVGVP